MHVNIYSALSWGVYGEKSSYLEWQLRIHPHKKTWRKAKKMEVKWMIRLLEEDKNRTVLGLEFRKRGSSCVEETKQNIKTNKKQII